MADRRRIVVLVGVALVCIVVVLFVVLSSVTRSEAPASAAAPAALDREEVAPMRDTAKAADDSGGGAPPSSTLQEGIANDAPSASPPRNAPARSRADAVAEAPVWLDRFGGKRLSCARACAAENACRFRDVDACRRASCDDDIRRPMQSDPIVGRLLERQTSCADLVDVDCAEACWKRGECAKDQGARSSCIADCRTLSRQLPRDVYVENRCILEHGCSDIAACGSVGMFKPAAARAAPRAPSR